MAEDGEQRIVEIYANDRKISLGVNKQRNGRRELTEWIFDSRKERATSKSIVTF